MDVSGAVEATKYLRDRSKDVNLRVKLARSILDEETDAIIPRKEIVILDWIFDMLAIDSSAKTSSQIWELLLWVWPRASEAGRLRVLRNHKVITIIKEALLLNSSEFVDLITRYIKLGSQTAQMFGSVSDTQANQLILAYLANEHAIANDDLKEFIYRATKSKPRIFGKCDPSVLSLILNEPNAEIKAHLAHEYLSSSSNAIIPGTRTLSDEDLKLLVEVVCETDVSVKERVFLLMSTYSGNLVTIFSAMYAKRPNYVDADLLRHMLTVLFTRDELDWMALSACLRVNASPLFENKEWLDKILELKSTPDEILGLILLKAAQLRELSQFLTSWTCLKPLSTELMAAYSKAVKSLSPLQVSSILRSLPPSSYELDILIRALSYQTANSDIVRATLTSLLGSDQLSSSLELHILQLIPNLERAEKVLEERLELALRRAEKDSSFYESVRQILAKTPCSDDTLLRFFPVINDILPKDSSELAAIIPNASKEARLQIAGHSRGAECQNIISAIINSAISNSELDILDSIPKAVLSWDQRHKAVSVSLKSPRDFAINGGILNKMIDQENLPPAKELGDFIGYAKVCSKDIDVVLRTIFLIRKDTAYTKSVIKRIRSDWLKSVIYSQLAQWVPEEFTGKLSKARKWLTQAQGDQQLMVPMLYVLSLLPPTQESKIVCKNLVLKEASQNTSISSSLFETICRQDHPWPVITALFLCAEPNSTEHSEHFANYCKTLSTGDFDALLYTAVDEHLYKVLLVLAHHRVIPVEQSKYQMVITVAVALAYPTVENLVADFSSYWAFCDALIREYPKMLSQFALEAIMEVIIRQTRTRDYWEQQALVISRIMLLKRQSLRNRLHLIVAALSGLLPYIDSTARARIFARLVDNLCNPPQPTYRFRNEKQALSSSVARERRHVAKHAGVLLQNMILGILQHVSIDSIWSEISTELRAAVFLLVDLIYGDGLKAVSAGMDHASRAYLRSVFEDYKLHGRWSSD